MNKLFLDNSLGAAIPQENDTYAYPWLEYNHINYRFVTASVNRGGAKGTCFPILAGTTRLPENILPNDGQEYHLLLDPCNRHDANLLYVDPTGQIHPKANLSLLNNQQIQNPDLHWHEEAINYIRALSTIIVYGLDDSSFVIGRQRKYQGFTELVNRLKDAIEFKEKNYFHSCITDIKNTISKHSEFALASRSALIAYMDITQTEDNIVKKQINRILSNIYKTVLEKEGNIV